MHRDLRVVQVALAEGPKFNACASDLPFSVRDLKPYAMEVVLVEAGEEGEAC